VSGVRVARVRVRCVEFTPARKPCTPPRFTVLQVRGHWAVMVSFYGFRDVSRADDDNDDNPTTTVTTTTSTSTATTMTTTMSTTTTTFTTTTETMETAWRTRTDDHRRVPISQRVVLPLSGWRGACILAISALGKPTDDECRPRIVLHSRSADDNADADVRPSGPRLHLR
jgi:hypothetical protein